MSIKTVVGERYDMILTNYSFLHLYAPIYPTKDMVDSRQVVQITLQLHFIVIPTLQLPIIISRARVFAVLLRKRTFVNNEGIFTVHHINLETMQEPLTFRNFDAAVRTGADLLAPPVPVEVQCVLPKPDFAEAGHLKRVAFFDKVGDCDVHCEGKVGCTKL